MITSCSRLTIPIRLPTNKNLVFSSKKKYTSSYVNTFGEADRNPFNNSKGTSSQDKPELLSRPPVVPGGSSPQGKMSDQRKTFPKRKAANYRIATHLTTNPPG